MKRRTTHKIKPNVIFSLIITACVLTISIGFSSFHSAMKIDNAKVAVRINRDMRITNAYIDKVTDEAVSMYDEYDEHALAFDINLPKNTSSVTYRIKVANFGNVVSGIYDITGLPTNLTYELKEYTLKTKMCSTSGNCSTGMEKEFNLVIKYKENGFDASQLDYSINLNVDFREVHTITFNPNSGTVSPTSKEVMHGDTYGSMPTPTRSGYDFDGWYNGTTLIKSTSVAYSDITLTAKWGQARCKIFFDAMGGTLAEEEQYKYVLVGSTTYGELPTPIKDNYSFKGWYTSPTGGTLIVNNSTVSSVTTDITLYARWEEITEIPWDGNNASVTYTKKVEKVTLPPGKYKLDVYGGQGGKSNHGTRGGYGGYSYGTLTLTKTTALYIAVGGDGATATSASGGAVLAGAWNGGGNGAETNNDSAGGGSASHIAFVPGLLYELETQKDQVIIVAGGGGGAGCSDTVGGDGGGETGGTGTGTNYHAGSGGTQTSGGLAGVFSGSLSQDGSFGLGGSTGTTQAWPGAGGGGGWYGGGAGANEPGGGGSGGGGSGYINTKYLTDAATTTSTHTGQGTITITKVS